MAIVQRNPCRRASAAATTVTLLRHRGDQREHHKGNEHQPGNALEPTSERREQKRDQRHDQQDLKDHDALAPALTIGRHRVSQGAEPGKSALHLGDVMFEPGREITRLTLKKSVQRRQAA